MERIFRLRLAGALLLASEATQTAPMMGVSYGPVPLRSQDGMGALPQDDWMTDEAAPMWGASGRGDLRVMKSLGANVVRLYGNNPRDAHANFLDEARLEGLSVLPGMSDWPFYQQVPGSCKRDTDYNCFSQIKPAYLSNLQRGFMAPNRTYHPALKVMNILNEPDLKMPPTTTTGGSDGPVKMCRSIISAFDAMLEAEKEAQIVGPLVNFTATFSYAICLPCTKFNTHPALGQMAQLDDAMRHPEKYGYAPRNDITAAYLARWTHSFNTQNPATDLEGQFLNDYTANFPSTPVYIGEYHRVRANQTQDLGIILDIARRNPLLLGISFFEYQVAYSKTGSEMEFGMLGLGSQVLRTMPYFGVTYNVSCLDPVFDVASGTFMADAVARVFGGPGLDMQTLCASNPLGVPLNEAGFGLIASQGSVPQMASFVQRAVEHLGATVSDKAGLTAFAGRYTGEPASRFSSLMADLGARPAWASFDAAAKCVADRGADPAVVGSAIGWACSRATTFDCGSLPAYCSRLPYTTADYVLSRYYEELGSSLDPLQDCSFGGAAVLAATEVYTQWLGTAECVAGAGPLPEPGNTTAPPSTTTGTSLRGSSPTTTAQAPDPATTTSAPTEPTTTSEASTTSSHTEASAAVAPGPAAGPLLSAAFLLTVLGALAA